MPYEGEILNACGVVQADFSTTYIVAVSGDGPNVCGHMLIYTPSGGGYYFHVTGDPNGRGIGRIIGYPMYMTENGYQRYLSETGKTELKRRRVPLPNPDGAYLYLEQVLSEKWTWGVLPHNCVNFVEEVISAGGGDWGSYSNCPAVAIEPTVAERLQQMYIWMDTGIRQLYGVPASF
jgi:hypothetical protein